MKKALIITILTAMFAMNVFASENPENPGCEKLASEERVTGKDVVSEQSDRPDRSTGDSR